MRNWLSKREPIFLENSLVPVFLSKFAPITIYAISLGIFVFSRGVLHNVTKRHETVHYHQQLELLFVGFWFLYIAFFLMGLIKYRDGRKAYYESPFEREARHVQEDQALLALRPMYGWTRFMKG